MFIESRWRKGCVSLCEALLRELNMKINAFAWSTYMGQWLACAYTFLVFN
jgi:hypothetical protein